MHGECSMGAMKSIEELEERIAQLRREIEDPEELVAADQAWRAAQADAQAAAGTPDEAEAYQRFRDRLDERNRIALPRILVHGEALLAATQELRRTEMQLAKLRGDPFFQPVAVDRSQLFDGEPSAVAMIRPDSSGSGEIFIQSAFGEPAIAFVAEVESDDSTIEEVGVVLVRFEMASPMPLWGVSLAKFGYPNEEAFGGYPGLGVGFDGIGFYEVANSCWAAEIVAFNRHRFPDTPDDLGLRHFVIACKENTLECLATGFSVRRVDGPLPEAVADYLSHDR